jgi:adenylosuccinate lyase
MELDALTALSPVDGRYASKTSGLREFFSEFGLMRGRVRVEIAWILRLDARRILELPQPLSAEARARLQEIADTFSLADARKIKKIEDTTRHDVKAVEYFLKDAVKGNAELERAAEFIHFACTSEDINNNAWATALRDARSKIVLPAMDELIAALGRLAVEHKAVSMMARTHGQPATPTTMGKELANFAFRLKLHRDAFAKVPVRGKMNGAVGNFNAHVAAYPDVDWPALTREFLEKDVGVEYNPYTTQIEPHDYMAELFDAIVRFNTVLLDLDRDMWTYISLGYFAQRRIAGEVGSSTMPHKVNPIDFENSEGNIGLANALFAFLSTKLPISRMQRDLTDSTVQRNIGVAFGHAQVAYTSTLFGLKKVTVDKDVILADLMQHWELLAEPVQTVMRRFNLPSPYEKLKEYTQGKRVTQEDMAAFIKDACGSLPPAELERLLALTPATYTGEAEHLAADIERILRDGAV